MLPEEPRPLWLGAARGRLQRQLSRPAEIALLSLFFSKFRGTYSQENHFFFLIERGLDSFQQNHVLDAF